MLLNRFPDAGETPEHNKQRISFKRPSTAPSKPWGSFKAGTNRKGWLFTILRKAWLNKLRESGSSMEVSLVDVDIADVAIDESMSAEGRLERLEQQNKCGKSFSSFL